LTNLWKNTTGKSSYWSRKHFHLTRPPLLFTYDFWLPVFPINSFQLFWLIFIFNFNFSNKANKIQRKPTRSNLKSL